MLDSSGGEAAAISKGLLRSSSSSSISPNRYTHSFPSFALLSIHTHTYSKHWHKTDGRERESRVQHSKIALGSNASLSVSKFSSLCSSSMGWVVVGIAENGNSAFRGVGVRVYNCDWQYLFIFCQFVIAAPLVWGCGCITVRALQSSFIIYQQQKETKMIK